MISGVVSISPEDFRDISFNYFFLFFSFKESTLLEFYKSLSKEDYPEILKLARNFTSIFASTYVCEQLFSRMKYIKSKNKSNLTGEHLLCNLRVATSQISPNIENLVKNMNVHKSQYQCIAKN